MGKTISFSCDRSALISRRNNNMARKTKSKNFTIGEQERLNDSVKLILPLGEAEWEQVTANYNKRLPQGMHERNMESLRRKFKKKYSIKKPTGDPMIPDHVRESKLLKRDINNRTGVQDLESDDSSDSEDDPAGDEDNDDDEEATDVAAFAVDKNPVLDGVQPPIL